MRAIEAAVAYARLEAERYQALQRKGAAAQVVVDNWNFQATKSEADLARPRGSSSWRASTSATPRCARPSPVR